MPLTEILLLLPVTVNTYIVAQDSTVRCANSCYNGDYFKSTLYSNLRQNIL